MQPPLSVVLSSSSLTCGRRFRRLRLGFACTSSLRALITFIVVLLVLYLVNMLPIDGRAKQIVRVIVIIIGVLSLLSYLVNF
jgi:hypothetical protein